jgi:hypothetical protein
MDKSISVRKKSKDPIYFLLSDFEKSNREISRNIEKLFPHPVRKSKK